MQTFLLQICVCWAAFRVYSLFLRKGSLVSVFLRSHAARLSEETHKYTSGFLGTQPGGHTASTSTWVYQGSTQSAENKSLVKVKDAFLLLSSQRKVAVKDFWQAEVHQHAAVWFYWEPAASLCHWFHPKNIYCVKFITTKVFTDSKATEVKLSPEDKPWWTWCCQDWWRPGNQRKHKDKKHEREILF